MNDYGVKVRKLLAASCEQVFDAWLDPAGMRAWMRPPAATDCMVTLDPRIGGRFEIVMAFPDGDVISRGEIVTLERPSKLQFTWISSRWDDRQTLVTIALRQKGPDCELVLTHDRMPAAYAEDELMRGWTAILDTLARGFNRASPAPAH